MIQTLITAPSITSLAAALVVGWLVTKISKKSLLVVGSLITGISGAIPLLSDSFYLLLGSRILYGVGLGLVTVLNTAVIAEHFEGAERTQMMGIQGAMVGTGMLLITTLSGVAGKNDFRGAYILHVIGLLAFLVIWRLLPDTGREAAAGHRKIQLNRKVFYKSLLGGLEYIFLISFNTNIAMHISGDLQGNSSISGTLVGLYSGIQIFAGLFLGRITAVTKKNSLPAAMLCFSVGAVMLCLFPSNLPILAIGALLCGLSQGIFMPRAMWEISNAVNTASTAMATACLTTALYIGQLISPALLNAASAAIFGEVATGYVFLLAACGMFVSAVTAILFNNRKETVRRTT